MKYLSFILLALLQTACSNQQAENVGVPIESPNKKIEITSDYIINENWNRVANSIKVSRMRLKKGANLKPGQLNQVDLVNKLEEDSSFVYVANVTIGSNENYSTKKVFFNQDNGFYWKTKDFESKTKILGPLERATWYKFSRLVTYPYHVYIYVDSVNTVHRFDVNLANY